MDLVREDAQRLARSLERHDTQYRQIANLRRELAPQSEALLMRRRRELAGLAQVESELRELKREGFVNKIARSVKEMVAGSLSREDLLARRRLDIVERLNNLTVEQNHLWRKFRELVSREETLLRKVYGERPLLPRLAPWLFGLGSSLAAVAYSAGWMELFWASMAAATAGTALFWFEGARHNQDRIFAEEEELWRRIRVHHDAYREKLLEELDNVGVLLKEFREPAVDALRDAPAEDLDFQRSVVSVLLELARKDDHVAAPELEQLDAILETELGLAGSALEQLRGFAKEEAARARPADLTVLLARFRRPEDARLLLRLLHRMAFADGRFYGREQSFIAQAARGVGVDAQQLESIRQEERTLAQARGLRLPEEPTQPIMTIAAEPVHADIAFVDDEPDGRTRSRGRGRERD